MDVAEKYPIQFRVGAGLLNRIEKAVEVRGLSRNKWIIEAVTWYLDECRTARCQVSAYEMLADKCTVTVRLDLDTIEKVDDQCVEKGHVRTIWLVDACLGYMLQR